MPSGTRCDHYERCRGTAVVILDNAYHLHRWRLCSKCATGHRAAFGSEIRQEIPIHG